MSGVRFVDRLGVHGDRTALITAGRLVTYAELAENVRSESASMGSARRLVLIEAVNSLDCLLTYLAALDAGQVVMLAPGQSAGACEALRKRYRPDVVAGCRDGVWAVEQHVSGTRPGLHPDLALLMVTSGSAGSPKLVRLSAANLQANAEAVAASLGTTSADRAITSMPISYCYGLSVVHSHLLQGGSLVVTDRSVVDEQFWSLVGRHGVTNFAGVPYTFDLLDRVGFEAMTWPALRLVTQAGGRLTAERVRKYAQLGQRQGWDFVVMYGQTEATARMAFLPPALALTRPDAVGRPVPGGRFRIDPLGGAAERDPGGSDLDEVGEIVYQGPNVMLGYAEQVEDLALGRTVTELRTGDLGRIASDGLLEITGRRSALLKIFGTRIDLEQVDALLASAGITSCSTGSDDRLAVAVEDHEHLGVVRGLLASELGLPPLAVRVTGVDAIPRLPSGKPDRAGTRSLIEPESVRQESVRQESMLPVGEEVSPVDRLRALYAEILDLSSVPPDSTFAGLGGDSLSYVALSVRLQDELGTLPDGWPTMTLAELAGQRQQRGSWARVDTSVALRATAITAVVGTHADLWTVRGGAHLLIGVAGYNAARFTFAREATRRHARRTATAIARMAVPSVVWIAAVAILSGAYSMSTALLVNGIFGPDRWGPDWHYWFVEALFWILVVTGLVLAIPAVRRCREAGPFTFALVLVGVGLLPRFDVVQVWTGPERGTPQHIFWIFALGWAAAEAARTWHRALVTLLAVLAIPGFFQNGLRDLVVLAGLIAIVWLPTIRSPRALARVLGIVASSSLYIYLTHWQVYPLLDAVPLIATLVSLAAGVVAWMAVERGQAGTIQLVRGLQLVRRLATRQPGHAASPAARKEQLTTSTDPALTSATLVRVGADNR